jgi:hypothetical protein
MKKKAYLLLSESDQGGVNNLHSYKCLRYTTKSKLLTVAASAIGVNL